MTAEPPKKKQKIDFEKVIEPSITSKYVYTITEESVGITEFIHPEAAGFSGIIKQRYTDFLVNEVDVYGNVIHLTEIGKLNIFSPQVVQDDTCPKEELKEYEESYPLRITEEDQKMIRELLDEETFSGIENLLRSHGKEPKELYTKAISNKEARTTFHKTIRRVFSNKLETTVTDDSRIRITWNHGKNNRRLQKSLSWADLGGEYCCFSLYKENRDTMEVISNFAKAIGTHTRNFGYAGTKDRRAVTVQRISAYKIRAERIEPLAKNLYGVEVGNFSYSSHGLELGDLSGNEFTIVLRNVKASEEAIHSALKGLQEDGFVNYYGMQRFGTSSIGTFEIGRAVLQADWETAIDLILTERGTIQSDSLEARRMWSETKNVGETLKLMPKRCVAECAILRTLAKNENTGWATAFQSIPRNLRLIYLHSYQSVVWNKAVSERLRIYGMKPVKGDLVQSSSEEDNTNPFDPEAPELSTEKSRVIRARHLCEEELHCFTIYDVVLPLPGFDIVYPENEIRSVYFEIMKNDKLDPLNMRRPIKECSLTGSYRNIVARPFHVDWDILHYADTEKQLVATDMDILEHRKPDGVVKDGPFMAVKIQLGLAQSQYATMALREVLKHDTSSMSQSLLTAESEDQVEIRKRIAEKLLN